MSKATGIIHQAGVIAYRRVKAETQILLLTSRGTGRWLIPKGHIDPGFTPAEAGRQEAYEEAGVRGVIEGELPLGFYHYFKRQDSGAERPATVEVYVLRVTKQLKTWPEMHERQQSWQLPSHAVAMVPNPGLRQLIHRFAEIIAR